MIQEANIKQLCVPNKVTAGALTYLTVTLLHLA